MKLAEVIEITGGGPGSGCNPQKGKCGRKVTGKKVTPTGKAKVPPVINSLEDLGKLLSDHTVEVVSYEGRPSRVSQGLHISGPALPRGDHTKLFAALKRMGYTQVGDKGFGPIFWNSKKAARLEVRFLRTK